MKLLFVSPFAPVPEAGHGGSTAAWTQLDALKRHHELTLLSFRPEGPYALGAGSDPSGFFEQQGLRFRAIPLRLDWWNTQVARLRALFTGRPVNVEAHRSRAMAQAIRETVASATPDAVVLQFPQMAQFIDACGATPAVMDVHDAYSVSAFRAIGTAPTLRTRLQRFVEWLRWVRYEHRYYPRFTAVLTLSEQDAYGLSAFTPQLNVVSVGVPVPLPDQALRPRRDNVIRFAGNLSHAPNRDALRFFTTRVFPRIRARRPGVIFEVAGKNGSSDLVADLGPSVTILGFVTDLPAFFREAGAVVVPLVSGGGVKIKTLEALAAGAAVVGTSIGFEGVSGTPGVHYHVHDDPAQMADCILSLLEHPDNGTRLGEQGRALIERDWSPASWEARCTAVLARSISPARDR